MRALLAWLLILALCGAFGYLQTRDGRGLQAGGEVPASLEQREGTWRKLTIGRPSGAEPLDLELWLPEPEWPVEQPLPQPEGEQLSGAQPSPGARAPQVAQDFVYEVPAGRVLSKICEEFYGTGRAPIPEFVATYNGMSSPDALRAGQTLLLPAWEVLFPGGRERP